MSIDYGLQDTIKRLVHLRLQSGDVLAIEYREPISPDHVERLAAAVNRHLGSVGVRNVAILLAENLGEIRTLDEGAMRRLGWERVKDLPVNGEGQRNG